MRKWPDFNGYGFDLYEVKDQPEPRVGPVEPDSPADTGGLKTNDYIFEVNGQNVENAGHKSVVNTIKQNPSETTLLVVDKVAYEHFRENFTTIDSGMENIEHLYTPEARPVVTGR